MAKAVVLLLSVLALANLVVSKPEVFDVSGRVYCDTCRLGFITDLSDPIEGATVRLTCRGIETNNETFSTEGKTDANGKYTLKVEGEHENDICEVTAITSPREDCKGVVDELVKGRVVCTENIGMHDAVRFVNALYFQKDTPLPGCKRLIDEMEPLDLLMMDMFKKN